MGGLFGYGTVPGAAGCHVRLGWFAVWPACASARVGMMHGEWSCILQPIFFLRFSSMSLVIASRSYAGAQPHSSRAALSSIEFGQESAIA